jgi:hypothetical protein
MAVDKISGSRIVGAPAAERLSTAVPAKTAEKASDEAVTEAPSS